MLSEQFFSRLQMSKLTGFKSDSSIKDLEKKGFLKPDIKPSKYSIVQTFFLFFCKELVDKTSLTWKDLITENFNEISQKDLYQKAFIYFFKPEDIVIESLEMRNSEDLIQLISVLNAGHISFVMFDNDVLNKQFDQHYELLNSIQKTKDINTVLIMPMSNGNYTIGVSLRRLRIKFELKCKELNIDLIEKIPA